MAICVSVMKINIASEATPIVRYRPYYRCTHSTGHAVPWTRCNADYDWLNTRSSGEMSASDDFDNLA